LKVSIILGTRPQIIKSAPVYSALGEAGLECDIVNTGQHYDYEMNRQFFAELSLPPPAANLNVGAGPPVTQVSAIVGALGEIFERARPDLAIVPGDTNSALAAGVACSKSGVPIAHLESGCRSGDFRMAEEVNRRLLDHMSQLLLCPTARCVENVRAEEVLAEEVVNVGDTMYDSLLKFIPEVRSMTVHERLGLKEGGYAFMTLHRAETVDDPDVLDEALSSVGQLPLPVAFTVHPRTRARMKKFGTKVERNVRLLDPLPYQETLALILRSKLVLTDSGGVQKEAFWLRRPSMILRESTEWGEIVDAGAAFLVGPDGRGAKSAYPKASRMGREPFAQAKSIFGGGNASAKVVRAVTEFLRLGSPR